MSNLIEQIVNFSDNYLQEKSKYVKAKKTVPSWSKLVDELPNAFKESAKLPDSFKIVGSIGKGLITEIPWLCFFDKDITESAQNGYYIVLLFKSDMSGFYFSLNQGWTQYENLYGIKQGKIEIAENAKHAQSILRTINSYNQAPINLGSSKTLGKGYELGNICSTYYRLDSLPSESDIINDLRNLMSVYLELKGLVGKNILNIKSSISEETYQEYIQEVNSKPLPEGPVSKKQKSNDKNKSSWYRDPSIAKTAIENSHHICSINKNHSTFTSKATGKPYVEAHHIIPMEYQDDFKYSIDVPENIAALCPNCHKMIHLAKMDEKVKLIKDLYESRNKSLKTRGIDITLMNLCGYYS